MKLIVGLGNTGDKYSGTRHNLGFMIVDELAAQWNLEFSHNPKLDAMVSRGEINGHDVVLSKPTTMMNDSGRAVSKLMQFYKIESQDFWLIYDELDLPFGRVRTRGGGGDAGHNGVASVAQAVGGDFIRWRIGIGKPTRKSRTISYVLEDFTASESEQLPHLIAGVICSLEDSLKDGVVPSETFNVLPRV